jgi:CelD/BcsL family acetyltransferase involved in cellulose biosynthesis
MLREADRLYGLKLGYDTDLARGSPGHAVLFRAIQWASARGMTSLDLGPDSDFKAYWGGTLEPMGSVHAFPPGLFGTAAVMQLTGNALIRRVRTRFSRPNDERRH